MAIAAFNNMTDGLDPNRRNRGHYVVNTNLTDDGPWVPYADGVWIQPCCFNVTTGGFSVVLKRLPGAKLGVHYTLASFVGLRCVVIGDTWSMTGLPSPAPSSTNQPVKRTRTSLPKIHPNPHLSFSWSRADSSFSTKGSMVLSLEIAESDVGRVVTAVEARGGRILSVQPVRQSLEDYFFRELGGETTLAGSLEEEQA